MPVADVISLTIDSNGDWWCVTDKGILSVVWGPAFVNQGNDLPRKFSILGNYPNPFNPSTTIEYSLPETGRVSLVIYTVSGQKVCELVSGILSAGKHSVVWDGRDQTGNAVSSGVYISRLAIKDKVTANRMLVVK